MISPRTVLAAALAVAAICGPASGQSRLLDRTVTFSVQSYDDPAHPYFVGRGRTVKVSGGVEFGLEPEGPQNGIDVVPVRVNIGPTRVEVDYSVSDPGILLEAKFNGYILRFETDCVLFQQARIDRDDTNMPLAVDAVSFDRGTLYINVSGLRYTRDSRFAVDLVLTDCPLS